jgi:hypothetical protein
MFDLDHGLRGGDMKKRRSSFGCSIDERPSFVNLFSLFFSSLFLFSTSVNQSLSNDVKVWLDMFDSDWPSWTVQQKQAWWIGCNALTDSGQQVVASNDATAIYALLNNVSDPSAAQRLKASFQAKLVLPPPAPSSAPAVVATNDTFDVLPVLIVIFAVIAYGLESKFPPRFPFYPIAIFSLGVAVQAWNAKQVLIAVLLVLLSFILEVAVIVFAYNYPKLPL